MTKYSAFIATSQDGYIADKDGSIDFLNQLNIKGDGGYKDYYDTVDAILYGSKTYDTILGFNLPEWPYKDKMSYVLTSNPDRYKPQEGVTFIQGIPPVVEELLKKHKHVWVMGGGNVINHYVEAKLINEMIISRTNTELGSGISLFPDEARFLSRFTEVDVIDYGDITSFVYERK